MWRPENGKEMAECRFCKDSFTPQQITKARVAIESARKDLGLLASELTLGQMSDLLLDNLPWLDGSVQARHLVIACMEG